MNNQTKQWSHKKIRFHLLGFRVDVFVTPIKLAQLFTEIYDKIRLEKFEDARNLIKWTIKHYEPHPEIFKLLTLNRFQQAIAQKRNNS